MSDIDGPMRLACAVVNSGVYDFIKKKGHSDYMLLTGQMSSEWLEAVGIKPLTGTIDELHEKLLQSRASRTALREFELQFLGKKAPNPRPYSTLLYNARLRLYNPDRVELCRIESYNHPVFAAVKAEQQRKKKGWALPKDIYHCKCCGQWHISKLFIEIQEETDERNA